MESKRLTFDMHYDNYIRAYARENFSDIIYNIKLF
jgi:hypothetical protein